MNDETDKTAGTEAASHREGRRNAPLIEGEAVSLDPPPAAPPRPPAAEAPARSSLAAALPGLAALLLGGVALYFALNPTVPDAARPEAVAALGQRLDRLETRLGALEGRPAPDLAPLSVRIAAVEKAAEGAGAEAGRALAQAQAAPAAPTVDLGPLEQRIGKLESRLDEELGPLRAALAAPKTEVRATQAPDAPGLAPNDSAAVAVAAESLRQQLDRGAPFAREVGALEKLGADPARLAKLKPLAAAGAPSAAQLAQDFAGVSPAMLRAARPARSETGDIMDRLARSAASLVRIRPVGESAGEDAPALVSRVEAALQHGDVAGAVAAYDRLPDDAKAPARDWATRARQRLEADAAARGLLDDAIDTLARK